MKHTHTVRSLPPLEGLTALLAAAREGSFSAAAAELGLTQGAVSRRIRSVESWLGTKLFERHGRGVRPTPAGQRLMQKAEQAFDLITETAEQWRSGRRADTVRMSVLPAFAKLWLLPRLGALQGAPPDLRIELTVEHRLADLEADDIDIAIRYGRGRWEGVDARLLFRERLIPVAAPRIARQLRRKSSDRSILDFPLIHDSDTGHWRAWLAQAGIAYRPRAIDSRFEDYDLVLAACEAGLGLAFLREPLAGRRAATGKLMAVSSRALENPMAHYIVTRVTENRESVIRLLDRMTRLAAPDARGYTSRK